MSKLTLDELFVILAGSGGDVDAASVQPEAMDMSFDELGCDSLSLIETAARIKRDLGVEIPDADVTELRSPRQILDLVNNA